MGKLMLYLVGAAAIVTGGTMVYQRYRNNKAFTDQVRGMKESTIKLAALDKEKVTSVIPDCM